MKIKLRALPHRLLLIGMGLMIPCYLFTALNTLLSPWELYGRNHVALIALTALCMAGLCFALRAADRHEAFFAAHEKEILIAAAVFYFVVQMIMAHALRFIPKTDAEQCFTAAQLLVDTGTFGSNERSWIYFTRCSNNIGFIYVLASIFRFFGAMGWNDRFIQAALTCSLLFTGGFLCSARICRRCGGVRAQSKMMILFFSCLPFLYCTTELYTDAFSLAFPSIIIYCFFRIQESKTVISRVLWAILFALASFVGAQMRFTAVISSMACLIVLLFSCRAWLTAFCAAALAGVFILGNALVDAETARHLDPEDIERRSLPLMHYIAMGLPVQSDEGYGQYGEGGWYIFTTSFEDPDERDAALLSEVIDRIYYLRYPNRLLHMMSRKNISTFGNGTFQLNEIIESDDHTPDNLVKQVIFEQGAVYPVYYHLTTALFAAQMLFACLACMQAIRRKDTRGAPLFISLLGAFLLLCIWETRGRYFFQFQMLLLCAAAMYSPKSHKNVLPE